MSNLENLLRQGSAQLGLHLSRGQMARFAIYLSLIEAGAGRANLVGPATRSEILIRHFLDSLSCAKSGKLDGDRTVIDVGTGAGLPGIPLKIVKPQLRLTLLDSHRKKVEFLGEAVRALALEGVKLVHGRAEDIAHQPGERETYDVALARALAPLPVALEYVLPFVRVGGYFVAQRGPDAREQVADSRTALDALGGSVEKTMPVEVPFLEARRNLVLVKKVRATPERYPRKAGIGRKRPIK